MKRLWFLLSNTVLALFSFAFSLLISSVLIFFGHKFYAMYITSEANVQVTDDNTWFVKQYFMEPHTHLEIIFFGVTALLTLTLFIYWKKKTGI